MAGNGGGGDMAVDFLWKELELVSVVRTNYAKFMPLFITALKPMARRTERKPGRREDVGETREKERVPRSRIRS